MSGSKTKTHLALVEKKRQLMKCNCCSCEFSHVLAHDELNFPSLRHEVDMGIHCECIW